MKLGHFGILGLLAVTAACSSGGSPSSTSPVTAQDVIVSATWNGSQLSVVRVAPDDHGPVTPAAGGGQPALNWELTDSSGAVVASGEVEDPSQLVTEWTPAGAASPFNVQGGAILELRMPNVAGTLTVQATTGSGSAVTGQANGTLHLQGISTGSPSSSSPVPLSTPSSTTSSPAPKELLNHGSCAPVNMLLVSEGYQAGDMATFESVVQGVIAGLPSFMGYSAHMNDINVWVLEVPSVDSGITDPGCANSNPAGMDNCTVYMPLPTAVTRNTAFGATFGNNIPRRAVTLNTTKQASLTAVAAAKRQVKADVTGYIFNDPGNVSSGYGGAADIAGQSFTTSSYSGNGNSVVSVAAHEAGHALFGLEDEYTYGDTAATCSSEASGTGNQGRGPFPLVNVTSNQAKPPWQADGGGGGGAIQGAYYCQAGWYRAQDSCLMQVLSSQFCSACLAHVNAVFTQKEQYSKCNCDGGTGPGDSGAAGSGSGSGGGGVGLGGGKPTTLTCGTGSALTNHQASLFGWWPFSWP
jgi:hypothetical protein